MSHPTLRMKWLSGILAAYLMLIVYAPVSMAAETQQTQTNEVGSTAANTDPGTINAQSYSDIPDHAWYAEAVNEWIARGILSLQPGDEFKPQFVTSRGDFAFLLAYSLGLAPSAKSGTFKDMPDGELAGYIAALQEAGLTHGYPDGTFRPNLPVTRAEAASWIAAAKKLTLEPQTSSPFRDVPPTSWYSSAVDALASTGIIFGKTKDRFAPGDSIARAETIALLYRSFYQSFLIQDIQGDDKIIIDGHAYRAGDSVKGIFQSSNLAVLHNAAIQFTHHGDTILSVENLHIGYKDALAGPNESLVFNAEGNAINGMVIVNADQVTLANLEVKGDLLLTPAFQTNFMAYDVLVRGETVYLEDTDRPKSQIANLEFQKSDLGKLVLENSANVKQVHVVPDQVSKNSKDEVRVLGSSSPLICQNNCSVVPVPRGQGLSPGLYVQVIDGLIHLTNPAGAGNLNFSAGQFGYTPSFKQPPIVVPRNPGMQFQPPPAFNTTGGNRPSTNRDPLKLKCDNVNCNVEAFVNSQVDTSLTGSISTVTVHAGASLQYLGSTPIDTLILGDSNTTGGASFTGSTNIEHVTVKGKGGKVDLNLKGTIGTLETTGNSQLNLTGSATIGNLIVPPGVDPISLFTNPSFLSIVSAINGKSTAPPVTTPSPVTPTPLPDTTSPNGISELTTAVQKIGSTIVATLTINDADAAAQGVNHYRVFVTAADANATMLDSYQQVTSAGAVDINLADLVGGAITPLDGQVIHFTVVAYDAAGNSSVPATNDMATVTWDRSGPSNVGMSVSFNDTDGRANFIGGTINVSRAIDQTAINPVDVAAILVKVTNGASNEWFSRMQEIGVLTTLTIDLPTTSIADFTNLQVTLTPVDSFGNQGTAVSHAVTDWAVPVPTQLAQNGAFSDTDQMFSIGGTLTWVAQNETDIESYEVYFLNSSDAKVGSAIASVNQGSEYAVSIPEHTAIPLEATQFGIYSKNAGGESEIAAKVMIFNDTGPPNGVNVLSVVQSNLTHATLTFTDPDADDQGVAYYKVFVGIGSETTSNFTEVSASAGGNATDIDLSLFNKGGNLVDGAMVYFTVVAVNQHGDSIPTITDKATVVWVVPVSGEA